MPSELGNGTCMLECRREHCNSMPPQPMAESTTIRIDRDVHAELKTIAEEKGLTLTDTLRKLVEQHKRDRMFEQSDRAYRRLHEDSDAWDEIEAERQEIEGTQAEGFIARPRTISGPDSALFFRRLEGNLHVARWSGPPRNEFTSAVQCTIFEAERRCQH